MWDLDSAFHTSSSPSAEVSVQMKETNHEGGRKNAEARGMKVFGVLRQDGEVTATGSAEGRDDRQE